MYSQFIGMKAEDVKRILEAKSVSFSIIAENTNPHGDTELVVKVCGKKIYTESFLLSVKENV